MQRIVIDLQISPEQYQKMYAGAAQAVRAVASDGRRIQFPASMLRPYVTASGIKGRFVFDIDANHKLQGLQRL